MLTLHPAIALAGTAGRIQKCTTTGTPCTLNDSVVYESGSMIGINGVPGRELEVQTTAQGNHGFLLDRPSGGFMLMLPDALSGQYNGLTSTGDQVLIYSKSTVGSGSLVIAPWANATSGLKMDSAGRVGIGGISPTSTLHVNGNILFQESGTSRLALSSNILDVYTSIFRVSDGVNSALWVDNTNRRVGVGGAPGANTLDVVSGLAHYQGNLSWSSTSDARLKRNIRPLGGALARLGKINTFEFEWNDRLVGRPGFPSGVQTGFVAQDLERNFPEWVNSGDAPADVESLIPLGEKAKSIAFTPSYFALVVQAAKELKAENDELKRELFDLKVLVCADHPKAAACNR